MKKSTILGPRVACSVRYYVTDLDQLAFKLREIADRNLMDARVGVEWDYTEPGYAIYLNWTELEGQRA